MITIANFKCRDLSIEEKIFLNKILFFILFYSFLYKLNNKNSVIMEMRAK